jgi:TIR domain
MQNKRVFISYSWDSVEHQQWVMFFANELRKKGIDAEVDVFETQLKSTNINKMMVEKVRKSDVIIIVLTENYANKADSFEGGVGFESQLTLPLLTENPDKIVPILRQGEYNYSFPFHLKGHHAIDFRSDDVFEDKFEELIYRLYQVPRYYVEPVGKVPHLESKIPTRYSKETGGNSSKVNDFADLNVAKYIRISDRDIDLFMKDSYKKMVEGFQSLFSHIQSSNLNFEFDQDDMGTYKTVFNLYVSGQSVNRIKVWYGGSFGRNTINLSYGRHVSMSDNSMNEIISHEIDKANQLKLKMTMNFHGNKNVSEPIEIVKEIWNNSISSSVTPY